MAQIFDIAERIGRLLLNERNKTELKPVQWEAMSYLSRANRFSRTPSSVSQYLGLTKGTVSQTLNALERRGLIEKTRDKADARSVRLQLTSAGEALLANDPVRASLDALETLPSETREQLADGLEQLLSAMIKQRKARPFEQCGTCRFFRRNSASGDPHLCALLNEPLSERDAGKICVEYTPS